MRWYLKYMVKFRLWMAVGLLNGLFLQQVVAQVVDAPEQKTVVLKRLVDSRDLKNITDIIPESGLSKKVIDQYSPALERQLKAQGLQLGDPILLRIFKVPAMLEVWVEKGNKFVLFKTYNICQFSGRLGPKFKSGDRQSPEGFYNVPASALNPNSSYFLSFNLGYPNEYDRYHGRTGSLLMVHGECASVGCYAMTNTRMAEIYTLMYSAFKQGQKRVQVQAYPFALTDNNMRKVKRHASYPFWLNLKEGYDLFIKNHRMLNVDVDAKGKYQFSSN